MYAEHDAVGQHTLAVHQLLQDMGYKALIFAEKSFKNSQIKVINFQKHTRYKPPDLVLYQVSTGSPVGEYLATRSEPLILNYHNITPSEFFDPWVPQIAYVLEQARQQLALLSKKAYAGIADSEFNAKDLYELGISNVSVVPVIFADIVRSNTSAQTQNDSPTLLFVGRLAPNKRLECIIAALALLRSKWKQARLVIVGIAVPTEYLAALQHLVTKLGLDTCVEFVGTVSASVRDSFYAEASVYVSASTHEGFCVPVVEAMRAGLPVVAHNSTVLPETVQDASLLVDSEDPLSLAKAIDIVLSNAELRKKIVHKGFERAKHFVPAKVRQEMRSVLRSLIETR